MVPETEILDCLIENFRLAAESCDLLAKVPARGAVYRKLLRELKFVENCCRQVAWYRDDTRWLRIGLMMEEAHKRAGNWLRTIPRTATSNAAHPLFVRLAENLRAGMKSAQDLRDKKTGRVGLILPEVQPAPIRTEGRLVQIPRGLIIPASA